MDWKIKKQLAIFLAVFFLFVSFVGIIAVSLRNPTCFDGKRNQGEEGVDCGGPCKSCLGNVKGLIVLWSRPLKVENGLYDAAALLKNPNISSGIAELKYRFKLFDKRNMLIGEREGKTFANPAEDFVILEANIDTGRKIPVRAFVELEQYPDWEVIKKEAPQISVSNKEFVNGENPRLGARINNKSIFAVKNVFVSAILYGPGGEAVGVSSTRVEKIEGGGFKDVSFLWPSPLGKEIVSSKVIARVNLSED